jgi:multidrug resistance protein MdtO
LDSADAGFYCRITLAFAAVTAIAAWFATASPGLSYLGRQVALAYDVAIFQGFAVRTPLAAAWNPQMGIFFGLLVMWLVFDFRWMPSRPRPVAG